MATVNFPLILCGFCATRTINIVTYKFNYTRLQVKEFERGFAGT